MILIKRKMEKMDTTVSAKSVWLAENVAGGRRKK
jgi:hypothetical protein